MDNITFKATISRNIIFKTLLLKGEAGNNIVSIEKTSTQGLVDTYTITLTDGTTTTFQVTNGSGIQSIVKTSTSGLIDTYTITYQNGETSFFTVTNGRSIVEIEKTSTVGVLDTYTISYNDNTTSTFTIKNGMDYTVPTNGVIMYDGNDTPEGYEDYAGTFGSGHTLENQSGTDMPQQPNMQFVDAQLANDATNERTTVEVVKQIAGQELQSAPDGLYLIPDDGSGAVCDAEDVGFTAPTGMTANNVQDAIVEVNGKTFSQKAGETIILDYHMQLGYCFDTNDVRVFLMFPFIANNTNYSTSITYASIDNVGNVTNSTIVSDKEYNGVTLSTDTSATAGGYKAYNDITIKITFA